MRKRYSTPTFKEKLRYLKVLEFNSMNKSATARMLNISRHTLTKYVEKHWDEYVNNKESVLDDSLTVEAKKMMLATDLDNIRIKLSSSFIRTVDMMNSRLDDWEQAKRISDKNLIQYIAALAPYVAEKKIAMGGKEPNDSPESIHSTYIQNIINHMNNAKINFTKYNNQ